MRNRILCAALAGVLALAFAACSSTTGADCGGDTGIACTDTTTGGGDTTPSGGDTTSGGDTSAPAPYMWVMICDKESPDCSTTGPGADIDAIELIVSGSTYGYAIGSSANVSSATADKCSMCGDKGDKECKYAADSFLSRIGGPRDAMVYADKTDDGYVSLNSRCVEFQIGDKTGAGIAQGIYSSDKLKVYEVDPSYKTDGRAYSGCICKAEQYEVWLRLNQGVDTGSVSLGTGTGTTTFSVP